MSTSLSLSGIMLLLAALIAGALVLFQAVSNATLELALGHPLWATVTSLLVSVIVIVPIVLIMRAPRPFSNPPSYLSGRGSAVLLVLST